MVEWLSSWLAKQEVWVRFPSSPLEFQRLVFSCFQVVIWLEYRLSDLKILNTTNQPTKLTSLNILYRGEQKIIIYHRLVSRASKLREFFAMVVNNISYEMLDIGGLWLNATLKIDPYDLHNLQRN